MAGRMITVAAPGGGAIESYLAAPAAGRGPGVAIVASIYGIEDCVKEYADKLAADGCVAAIPNMFWRDQDSGVLPQGAEAHKRAIARSERLDLDTSMADLAAVIADLKKRPDCNGRIAVLGYCFGGPYVVLAASRLGTDLGVSYHGSHVGHHLGEFAKVRCPLSFHYGDKDNVAPMSEIEEIRKACARIANAEVHVYPGGGHGYMLTNRKDYLPDAAAASWRRTMELIAPLRSQAAAAQ